jgi:hypothetical protein
MQFTCRSEKGPSLLQAVRDGDTHAPGQVVITTACQRLQFRGAQHRRPGVDDGFPEPPPSELTLIVCGGRVDRSVRLVANYLVGSFGDAMD